MLKLIIPHFSPKKILKIKLNSLNENFGSDLISKFNFIIKKEDVPKKQSLEVKSQELIMFGIASEKGELESNNYFKYCCYPFKYGL